MSAASLRVLASVQWSSAWNLGVTNMNVASAGKKLKILCAALALLVSPRAWADSGEAEEAHARNRVGGFIGVAGSNRRENGLTLALSYERLFTEHFGFGAEVERV